MSGSGIYKSYKRADAILQESGYLKAHLNLRSDFTTLHEPTATPVATGENKRITGTHVWAAGKSPMGLYLKKESIEAPAESVGDPGSLKLLWNLKFALIGDGPVAQDLVESSMNEELIAFVKDQCQNGERLQFGCDCLPAWVNKANFQSGTLPSGSKAWFFEVNAYCRFFYEGTFPTDRA